MKQVTVVLMLLTASAFAGAGGSTSHASATKNVKGSGCVEKAAENSCRVVIDSQTGELYNLLFPAKTPRSGTAIQFSGTKHAGANACVQGKPVMVAKWKKEKGIKCPPPAVIASNR